MGVSLFCRLSEAHPQAISALQSQVFIVFRFNLCFSSSWANKLSMCVWKMQYRMCAGIMELSNALIYGNRLHCGSSEVENAKLKYTSSKYVSTWLKEVILSI